MRALAILAAGARDGSLSEQQRMQLFDMAKVYSAAFSARYAWSAEEAVTMLPKLEETARIQEAKSGNDLAGSEISI